MLAPRRSEIFCCGSGVAQFKYPTQQKNCDIPEVKKSAFELAKEGAELMKFVLTEARFLKVIGWMIWAYTNDPNDPRITGFTTILSEIAPDYNKRVSGMAPARNQRKRNREVGAVPAAAAVLAQQDVLITPLSEGNMEDSNSSSGSSSESGKRARVEQVAEPTPQPAAAAVVIDVDDNAPLSDEEMDQAIADYEAAKTQRAPAAAAKEVPPQPQPLVIPQLQPQAQPQQTDIQRFYARTAGVDRKTTWKWLAVIGRQPLEVGRDLDELGLGASQEDIALITSWITRGVDPCSMKSE